MNGRSGQPPILPGCDVLPALEPSLTAPARPPHRGEGAMSNGKRRKIAGRFAVLNAFVDSTLRGVCPSAAAVWLVLYRDTKPDGLVRTSQSSIAERAGLSVRSVRRALVKLQAAGALTVVVRGSLRRGPSVYRIRAGPT